MSWHVKLDDISPIAGLMLAETRHEEKTLDPSCHAWPLNEYLSKCTSMIQGNIEIQCKSLLIFYEAAMDSY